MRTYHAQPFRQFGMARRAYGLRITFRAWYFQSFTARRRYPTYGIAVIQQGFLEPETSSRLLDSLSGAG